MQLGVSVIVNVCIPNANLRYDVQVTSPRSFKLLHYA